MTEIPTGLLLLKVLKCSLISAGPVAQFIPIKSTPRDCKEESAADISEPRSIVPVVSTVTWAMIKTSLLLLSTAALAPFTAAFAWSRS